MNCVELESTKLFTFTDVLGGDNKEITFSCPTPGRTHLAVSWYHDDEELIVDTVKYRLNHSQDRLSITNIVASDEGHYSCSYVVESDSQNSDAGCLTVYGECTSQYLSF